MVKKTRKRLFHRGGVVEDKEIIGDKSTFRKIRSMFKTNVQPPPPPPPTPRVNVAMLTKKFEDMSEKPEPPTKDGMPYENQNVHAHAKRNANLGGKKRKSVKKRKIAKKKSLKKRKLSKKRKSLKKRR